MSGTRPNPAERLLAEQHLGDRLSALVDGELGHETRERVLAHLATCARCKSEVDAQRRLKNVFAEAAPPPPSESFLARLQGLPGGGDLDGGGSPLGGGGFGGLSGRPGSTGAFGVRRSDRFEFGYVPSRAHAATFPASGSGFRTHPVGRHDADRSSSSRMRFAFVAAGAVSLAAIALGGVTSSVPTDAEARGGSGSGSNVTPARTQGTGAATTPENQRRRAVGPLLAQGQGTSDTPVAPTEVSAPLLPGMPAQPADQDLHTLTAPVVAGAAAMSPLIRPLSANPPLALTAWSTTPGITATPDLLAASVPDTTSSPSASPATGP
ncbi:anti-sigma factor [Streptomyces viridochromogenes]|uniref:anti-sigma factor n=1 Tax=Streptomyces viridochromogenes TaxID=1938 RepID=UPI00069EA54F|nr:anti-sigma factor [Streptomyces viridochromogenes]KOG08599.1 membrane protein [Streptomyces viridochromogenes]KOG08724.1 membrane protein [Streptomyces viridochromogenes]